MSNCTKFRGVTMPYYIAMTSLGEYIAKLRVEKGLSYRDLSLKSGVTFATIQDIESGRTKDPGISKVIAIADALGIRPEVLWAVYKGKDPNEINVFKQATDEEIAEALEIARILRERKNKQ